MGDRKPGEQDGFWAENQQADAAAMRAGERGLGRKTAF